MKWYKRDPDAAIAGMACLTLEEKGVYTSFIDLFYSRDGRVLDDDWMVAKMIHVNPRTWRKHKIALFQKQKITVDSDGYLIPNRGEYTLNEARIFSEKQSNRAQKRWEKSENNNENNDPPMPLAAMPKQPQPQPQPHPESKKEGGADAPKPRTKIRTRLAEDWQPSPDDLNWAALNSVRADVVPRETERFKNHHIAKGNVMADWSRAWRNWVTGRFVQQREVSNGVESDRERGRRESREALAKLREWSNSKDDGEPSGAVVQLLPRPTPSGGFGIVPSGSGGTVLPVSTRNRLQGD